MKTSNKKINLTLLSTSLALALSLAAVSSPANASSHASEVRAAQAAKVSLQQAITIASKQASGTLVSAEFDDDDSDAKGGVYEIELNSDSNNYEIKVDATTGKVIKKEVERLDSGDINDFKVQQRAKINIMQAKSIAEKQVKGKVMEIEFKNDRDYADHHSYYEIEILKGNQIIELNVDADTGKTFDRRVKK